MAKLHELLAVETNFNNQAGKTRTELAKTFADKRHLFQQVIQTYKPFVEGAREETEQQSDIQTSVLSEIKWLMPILSKHINTSHNVDIANTLAKADIITEDSPQTPLLVGIPTTSLLRLEHRVQELHDLVDKIPTLDPAKGFQPDVAKGDGYYKARDVVTKRTKKVFAPVVMVPASKEHPAQVEKLFEDQPVGEVHRQEWSSLITPAIKADLLDRCDRLARAIKKARARANEQEVNVEKEKIGETLLSYVFDPLLKKA